MEHRVDLYNSELVFNNALLGTLQEHEGHFFLSIYFHYYGFSNDNKSRANTLLLNPSVNVSSENQDFLSASFNEQN